MKIRCLTNSLKALSLNKSSNYTLPDAQIFLTIGKEYIAYALSQFYDEIWYCVCDESYTYYPVWYPKTLFEISDNRLSEYWVFSFKEDLKKERFFFGFPEWADQLDFYDKLTDGEKKEVEIFKGYKELMDLEFPDSSISETAQIGDDQWLICPKCTDAWQNSDNRDALVRCSKCSTIFNNPRYKDVWPGL